MELTCPFSRLLSAWCSGTLTLERTEHLQPGRRRARALATPPWPVASVGATAPPPPGFPSCSAVLGPLSARSLWSAGRDDDEILAWLPAVSQQEWLHWGKRHKVHRLLPALWCPHLLWRSSFWSFSLRCLPSFCSSLLPSGSPTLTATTAPPAPVSPPSRCSLLPPALHRELGLPGPHQLAARQGRRADREKFPHPLSHPIRAT